MKKIKIVIILVLILILLVGCTSLPSLSFLGGKQDKAVLGRGLKMYFMAGAPPTDRILISQNSKFLVRVGIDNYGKGVSGKLKLWDNIPGGIEDIQKDIDVSLDDAIFLYNNKNDPNQITQITPSKNFFPKDRAIEVKYDPNMIAPGTKLNLFAELSVNGYTAEIPTSFCLKRENDANAPCSNQEVITSAKLGQAVSYLPVTIDRIEKTATPFGENNFFVDFKIVMKNLGGGDIIDDSGKKDALNSFEASVDGGRGRLICSPDPSQIVFNNNEATINCIIENLEAGQSYTDHALTIRYSFPYKMRIKAGPIPLAIIEQNIQS